MEELDRCRKRTILKSGGSRRVGRPKFRWFESFEEGLKKKGVRKWRRKSQDREAWRIILEEAEVHQGL